MFPNASLNPNVRISFSRSEIPRASQAPVKPLYKPCKAPASISKTSHTYTPQTPSTTHKIQFWPCAPSHALSPQVNQQILRCAETWLSGITAEVFISGISTSMATRSSSEHIRSAYRLIFYRLRKMFFSGISKARNPLYIDPKSFSF